MNYAFSRMKLFYRTSSNVRHAFWQGLILLIVFTVFLKVLEVPWLTILISDAALVIYYCIFMNQKSAAIKIKENDSRILTLFNKMALPTLVFVIVLYSILDRSIFKDIFTTFIGSIIAIFGGYFLVKNQINYEKILSKQNAEKQKNYTLLMLIYFLKSEININSIRLSNDKYSTLEVKEWENLKYRLIPLLEENEFNENILEIVELYDNIYEYNERAKYNQNEIGNDKSNLINGINHISQVVDVISNKITLDIY